MKDDEDDKPPFVKGFYKLPDGQTPEEVLEELFGEDTDIQDISEAPEEVQQTVRELLLSGQIEIPDEVLADAKAYGVSKDDIIAGMLGTLKRKH